MNASQQRLSCTNGDKESGRACRTALDAAESAIEIEFETCNG